MAKRKRTTTDAVEIMHHRYIKGSKKRLESIERESEKLTVAEQIYRLRTKAGLTQKQLANMIGTTQSVISRLEDADYDGYTLPTLAKIATSLHQKVQVRFVPEDSHYAFA
jgi:ribosome-binding protein aMBF1 (putative translation factor)